MRGQNDEQRHVPGEWGIWIVVFVDLIIFSALFANYAWFRTDLPGSNAVGLSENDQRLGAINTALLLTSSWLVVLSMVAVRALHLNVARRRLLAAGALGIAFVAIKVFEYSEKVAGGIGSQTNEFFTFYFVITGLHLVHVVVGIGVLTWMRGRIRTLTNAKDIQALESGATFWHMVDLLWIVIFPLVYLL